MYKRMMYLCPPDCTWATKLGSRGPWSTTSCRTQFRLKTTVQGLKNADLHTVWYLAECLLRC